MDTSQEIQDTKPTRNPQKSGDTPRRRNEPQKDTPQDDGTNFPQRRLAQKNQNPPGEDLPPNSKKNRRLKRPP